MKLERAARRPGLRGLPKATPVATGEFPLHSEHGGPGWGTGRTSFPFEAKGQPGLQSRKPKGLPGLYGPSAVKGTPPPLAWSMRFQAVYTCPSSRPQGPGRLYQVPCRVGAASPWLLAASPCPVQGPVEYPQHVRYRRSKAHTPWAKA